MSLPFHVWAPFGREAWEAGRHAISSGGFVFVYTYEDRAYSDLKHYAGRYARAAVADFAEQHALIILTPAEKAHLTAMYIHAFVNGAFDQLLSGMPSL